MSDKLRGAFHGCPHHGDDYEACIQHSGTAPCGVTEERDALAAHVKRIAAYKDWLEGKGLMPARLAGIIEEVPETSMALLVAEKQADALEEAADCTVPAMHKMAHWLRARATDTRRQAEGGPHE